MVYWTPLKSIAAVASCVAILSGCGGNEGDTRSDIPAPAAMSRAPQLLAETTTASATNLLSSPGFETTEGWEVVSDLFSAIGGVVKNSAGAAHSGSYYAEVGSSLLGASGIRKEITLPSGKPYLQFWYNITAGSPALTSADDRLSIRMQSSPLLSLTLLDSFASTTLTSGWKQSGKYDLSAFAGQKVQITFYGTTGLGTNTAFRIDDVVVAVDGMATPDTTTTSSNTFSGTRSDYTITKTAAGYIVTDKTGATASRTLTGVTSIKFSDVTINLGVGDKAQTISSSDLNSLIELYIAYFNRVPDADGLAYWIDQFNAGKTLEDISKSFYDAAVQYPTLTGYSTTMTNADFVTIVYKNVLGRSSVDAGGLAYWTSALANGSETRGTLVKTILASAHTFKGDATYGSVANLLDNKIKVGMIYAVQQGLTYNSATDSVSKGIAIAAATTSTSTSTATAMYGLVDPGFSIAPACVTNGNCVISKYTLSPASLDFGSVTVGECGAKSFSVQSSTGSALATGVASTSGAFSISSAGNFSVSNGSSSAITVQFCPTSASDYSGAVTLTTNATISGSSAVALTGTGKSAVLPATSGGAHAVIRAGYLMSMAIKPDGTVWGWGYPLYSFGDGVRRTQSNPVQIGTGFSKIAEGSGGVSDTYHLIKTDGTLWGWGANGWGQLGDGAAQNRDVLTQIGSGYKSVSNAMATTLAIKTDGSLWSWGKNSSGVLGDGTQAGHRLAPAQIGTGYSAAVMGGSVAAALKTDGSLWIWGSTGSNINYSPKQYGTGFVSISAGNSHLAAIKSDGTLWMYGSNFQGEQGTPAGFLSSYSLKLTGSGYIAVAAGSDHTVALKADGSLWTWGGNQYGQLGDGTTTSNSSQRQIGTGYVAVYAGGYRSFAVKSDGSVWAWGYNEDGELGDGTVTSRTVPKRVLLP